MTIGAALSRYTAEKSPVLNRAGEVVGVNFDRNRHGLVRNFVYTEEQARHIAVHCRAVLEATAKLYDAGPLVAELMASKTALMGRPMLAARWPRPRKRRSICSIPSAKTVASVLDPESQFKAVTNVVNDLLVVDSAREVHRPVDVEQRCAVEAL